MREKRYYSTNHQFRIKNNKIEYQELESWININDEILNK